MKKSFLAFSFFAIWSCAQAVELEKPVNYLNSGHIEAVNIKDIPTDNVEVAYIWKVREAEDSRVRLEEGVTLDGFANDIEYPVFVGHRYNSEYDLIAPQGRQFGARPVSVASDLGLSVLSTTMYGANSRPLTHWFDSKGLNFWSVGDVDAYFEATTLEGGFALTGVGASRNFKTFQLNLFAGAIQSDQAMLLGGEVKTDSEFVSAEVLLPVIDHNNSTLWGSLAAALQDTDIKAGRVYSHSGKRTGSLGKTSSQSWLVRGRLEWQDLVAIEQASVNPYIDVSYSETDVDSYMETTGPAPIAHAGATQSSTASRLGFNTVISLDDQLQLTGLVERVRQEDAESYDTYAALNLVYEF